MFRRFSLSSIFPSTSSLLLSSSTSTAISSSLRYKSEKEKKKKSQQQKLHQEGEKEEVEKIQLAKKIQFEEETRAFDLRVHQEEIAEFKQHELESTFEMVDGEIPLSNKDSTATKSSQETAGDEENNEIFGQEEEPEGPYIPSPAPDLLMVQLCDHMQHDQGVKRHAVTITFGSDGFRLANMCKEVRRDLKKQLATSYWQMHQTQERSAFFVCTRISHGTADLLITSMTQRVVGYVEKFGYKLNSSYVTLSPDVQHTSVRMLYHYFIFRRTDESKVLEAQLRMEEKSMKKMKEGGQNNEQVQEGENDDSAEDGDDDDGDQEFLKGQPEFRNFEPPQVGPQEPSSRTNSKMIPKNQKVDKIWKD